MSQIRMHRNDLESVSRRVEDEENSLGVMMFNPGDENGNGFVLGESSDYSSPPLETLWNSSIFSVGDRKDERESREVWR